MRYVLFFALALAGCASSGPVQLAPDTYMISRTDKGGIFGNAGAMKADVIREANEFAAKQGKVMVALNDKETPLVVGRQFASYTFEFRVVNANDPEATRVRRVDRPDVVIQQNGRTTVEAAPAKRDLYTELTKLDDLRKRGLLTDAEFEAQKKALLNGN